MLIMAAKAGRMIPVNIHSQQEKKGAIEKQKTAYHPIIRIRSDWTGLFCCGSKGRALHSLHREKPGHGLLVY